MSGLLLFVLLMLGTLFWWRLLKGKELARSAASEACRQHGLSLMDDTVVLDAIQLTGDERMKSYGLRYRFDFAHEGILRKGGKVLVSPGRPATVILPTSTGQVIEEI